MGQIFNKLKNLNETFLVCLILVGVFAIFYSVNLGTTNKSALLSGSITDGVEDVVDTSGYTSIMPVQLGTTWVYEGKRIFYDSEQKMVIETVGQKTVEIIKMEPIGKKWDKLRVFTKTSYKNEPRLKDGEDSFLISRSGYAFDGANLAYFPLVKGQLLTAPDLERTDGRYVDYVSSVSVKNVFGKQYRCYEISYYGLPDETLDTFCEGIGYIRDSYTHHGTPDEWDYKLIRIEH